MKVGVGPSEGRNPELGQWYQEPSAGGLQVRPLSGLLGTNLSNMAAVM